MRELYTILFIALAGICNAVMDTLAHHFYTSIFNDLKFNPQFWNPLISWENKYSKWLPVAFTDAWHLFKSGMLTFLSIAITINFTLALTHSGWDLFINFIIIRIVFGLMFDLFYDILLLKSKK